MAPDIRRPASRHFGIFENLTPNPTPLDFHMPYLWTRPRRRRIYGGLIWLLYLCFLAGLWGVSRQSWLAYSEIPLLGSAPMMQSNLGRKTTVFGMFSYLTIDRDSVDPTGARGRRRAACAMELGCGRRRMVRRIHGRGRAGRIRAHSPAHRERPAQGPLRRMRLRPDRAAVAALS